MSICFVQHLLKSVLWFVASINENGEKMLVFLQTESHSDGFHLKGFLEQRFNFEKKDANLST